MAAGGRAKQCQPCGGLGGVGIGRGHQVGRQHGDSDAARRLAEYLHVADFCAYAQRVLAVGVGRAGGGQAVESLLHAVAQARIVFTG